jgi:hypothetical protein
MAHTHEFDCRVCGAHLDSRNELEQHTREKHPAKSAGAGGQSGSSRVNDPQRGQGSA